MAFRKTKHFVIIMALLGDLLSETKGLPLVLVCNMTSLQTYKPLTQDCVNGYVIDQTTSSSTQSPPDTNTSLMDPASTASPLKHNTCSDHGDVMFCNRKLQCGRNEGYKCCGFGVYLPGNQTCCQRSSSEYAIHDAKPEKSHICCALDVYVRGSSEADCQHSADNDKFFQKPKTLKHVQRITVCQDAKYVFRVVILQQVNGQYLAARVGTWAWPPAVTHAGNIQIKTSPDREEVMKIKLDRYSPMEKNLKRKTFIIFSRHQYLDDAVMFLRKDDVVYRSPRRRRKMIRKLKKTYHKC